MNVFVKDSPHAGERHYKDNKIAKCKAIEYIQEIKIKEKSISNINDSEFNVLLNELKNKYKINNIEYYKNDIKRDKKYKNDSDEVVL